MLLGALKKFKTAYYYCVINVACSKMDNKSAVAAEI
jgi:hypothetical protein